MKPDQLREHVNFTNTEMIEEALKQDKPVLLALAHHCNQEWAILAASQFFNFPIDGIYKPLHVKWLDELAYESRSRFNVTLIPAKNSVTELIKRANQSRVIAIAADQAPRRRDEAYWTNFMNQDTPFYLGLEKIAVLFKYPVYFMELKRIPSRSISSKFQTYFQPTL